MRWIPLSGLMALGCFIVLAAPPAFAQQLINLNFGAAGYTTAAPNETSPATPMGSAGTWNNLTTNVLNAANSVETDSVAVLLADGSPGPTLTLDASGGTSISNAWNGGIAFQTRDFTTLGGVYDVPALYEAGLVNDSNARTTGFRIKGLTPGNYEVFVTPFFRSEVQAGAKVDPAKLTIGLGNDTDARNAGDYTLTTTSLSPTMNIDTTLASWVNATDGSTAYNYLGATIAIDSPNRWLTFQFQAPTVSAGGDRPGASTIQLRLTGGGPVELVGDYNQDNRVNAADYTLWRDNDGSTFNLPNDGPLDGTTIGAAHYAQWMANFGAGTGPASAASATQVPEPTALALTLMLLVTGGALGRTRGNP